MAVNFYNGYVADDAATDASEVRVSVPNLTIADRIVYGPLPFRPNIGQDGGIRIPSRGDRCIIAVDDSSSGEQWIVSWVGSHISHQTTSTIVDLYNNRPVASSALNGTRFFASDKMMEWICSGGAWVLLNVLSPDVSVLPSSPIDQQECQYVSDAAGGIKWHLKYRAGSSSAYKWEYIGGSSLFAEVETNETCNSDAVIRDLATVGPSLVPPLNGDYEFELGASMSANPGGAGAPEGYCYLNVNGTTDTLTLTPCIGANGVSTGTQSGARMKRKTGLTGGQTVKLVYQGNSTGGSLAVSRRWIRCRPVRVG